MDVGRWAEAAGIDQLDIAEHLLMGDGKSYPFGEYPAPLDDPWPEPIAALAAIAAVTHTVRLGTGVLIAPLRPPALLAKQLATLDRISNGRLDIGLAAGWQREEYQACAIPFAQRNQRMDDTVRACRALWTGERVTLKLPTVELDNVLAVPDAGAGSRCRSGTAVRTGAGHGAAHRRVRPGLGAAVPARGRARRGHRADPRGLRRARPRSRHAAGAPPAVRAVRRRQWPAGPRRHLRARRTARPTSA
jgi:alkanesulfonate monooxygenase SsuD/methylene tetrahydromethanopterin reductase-like flavin-dependent oxidoreductase (luciferase family)